MAQENLDALKRFYERWAVGDWTDTSIFDRYAVGVMPDPTPQPHYGLEAMGKYWRRFLEGWDDIRMRATEYRQAGDSFVVSVRRLASGSGSGVEVADQAFHVWTFRGERAIRIEVFEREDEALEAAGLSE